MKLALIAFDGLDPRVVYDKIDRLPAFRNLIEDSMHGTWKTPGHTIPSFTATLTGKQYNNTNFHWDKGKGDYQRHRQTEFNYLWDLTDSSMTLLNIPVLYPPEDIDDAMVCGFLTPDSAIKENLARPLEVQQILNNMEPPYIHDVHADNTFNKLGEEGMLYLMQDIMCRRVSASKKLINKYDSDLFYGVWTSTDRWFHQCHKHNLDYMPLYKKADMILSKMINIIPDDIPLVVFSDHGFAHLDTDKNKAVHKGHMYNGFYAIRDENTPSYRDDSSSIFDLFPTVLNYLNGELNGYYKGKILFHSENQHKSVEKRLDNLGYLE